MEAWVATAFPGSSAALGNFVAAEDRSAGQVVKLTGIKPE